MTDDWDFHSSSASFFFVTAVVIQFDLHEEKRQPAHDENTYCQENIETKKEKSYLKLCILFCSSPRAFVKLFHCENKLRRANNVNELFFIMQSTTILLDTQKTDENFYTES